ncbi:MAG: hypothetical protein KGH88_05660 [Thaumarchaeota archaeon]|nr:hypothetical protein [Nitrososphaerota archaeon]
MIGKLLVFGVIVAVVMVVAFNFTNGNTRLPALGTVKERIDSAANHAQGNSTSSVGYGGIFSNSDTINAGKEPGNAGSKVSDQTRETTRAAQDVIKQTYTGQVFQNANGTCQVSVPGMEETINGQTELTHIIQVPNCNLPVNKPVQVISTTPKQNSTQLPDQGNAIQVAPYVNSNNDGSASTPANPNSSQTGSNNQSSSPPAPPYFQTVQLNAINQGTDALLSYDDTTGQTIQVTVTMKNSDKVLFSGTFYSSQFHTEIDDIPNTPHIIEMTIQNAIYGTLHASVYVPSSIQNSTISGIFTS